MLLFEVFGLLVRVDDDPGGCYARLSNLRELMRGIGGKALSSRLIAHCQTEYKFCGELPACGDFHMRCIFRNL